MVPKEVFDTLKKMSILSTQPNKDVNPVTPERKDSDLKGFRSSVLSKRSNVCLKVDQCLLPIQDLTNKDRERVKTPVFNASKFKQNKTVDPQSFDDNSISSPSNTSASIRNIEPSVEIPNVKRMSNIQSFKKRFLKHRANDQHSVIHKIRNLRVRIKSQSPSNKFKQMNRTVNRQQVVKNLVSPNMRKAMSPPLPKHVRPIHHFSSVSPVRKPRNKLATLVPIEKKQLTRKEKADKML